MSYLDARLTDPWGTVMEALACQARSEPLSDELAEATELAATLLCAKVFMAAGLDADEALDKFERDHTFHFAYNAATETLTVEVKWEDGDVTVCAVEAGP